MSRLASLMTITVAMFVTIPFLSLKPEEGKRWCVFILPVFAKFKFSRAIPEEASMDPGWDVALDDGANGLWGLLQSAHQWFDSLQATGIRP